MSEPHSLHPPAPIQRRSFLAAAGIAVAGAAAVPLLRPRTAAAHDQTCACLTSWSGIWSVAKVGGKYVALAGRIDAGTLEIRTLDVGADSRVTIGGPSTTTFPAGFQPTTLFGFGDRLLVAGGLLTEVDRITVDYTVSEKVLASAHFIGYNPPVDSGVAEIPVTTLRPALFENVGRELLEIPLGAAAAGLSWGTVRDIVSVSPTGLVVLIEGSASVEMAYGERTLVAESADGGSSWSGTTIASRQGEASPGALTVTSDAVLATTVSHDGKRTFFQRPNPAGQPWTAVDTGTEGLVLGTVAGKAGAVVFEAEGDRIQRRPYDTATRSWAGSPADVHVAGKPVHAVLTIGGAPTEWLAVTETDARLVREA
jgi:hypothetical protein